jgi:hypothetical protein
VRVPDPSRLGQPRIKRQGPRHHRLIGATDHRGLDHAFKAGTSPFPFHEPEVGRDSVEPTLEHSEASNASIFGPPLPAALRCSHCSRLLRPQSGLHRVSPHPSMVHGHNTRSTFGPVSSVCVSPASNQPPRHELRLDSRLHCWFRIPRSLCNSGAINPGWRGTISLEAFARCSS